jgi:hypothetical protein
MDQLKRVGKYLGLSFTMDGLTAVVLGIVFADQWSWAIWAGIIVALVLIPAGGCFWAIGRGVSPGGAAFVAGGFSLVFLGLVGVFLALTDGPRWLVATIVVSLLGAGLIVAGRGRE